MRLLGIVYVCTVLCFMTDLSYLNDDVCVLFLSFHLVSQSVRNGMRGF